MVARRKLKRKAEDDDPDLGHAEESTIKKETQAPAAKDPDLGHAEESSIKKETQAPAAKDLDNPFPAWARPSPEACMAATEGLRQLHGDPRPERVMQAAAEKVAQADAEAKQKYHTHSQHSVLDSLVRTILSQNTTDVNSSRAFSSLKEAFPTWEAVLKADDGDVEAPIKMGGLAAIKTQRLKAILSTLKEERGECSLEYLRHCTDMEIKSQLERFKGVGKKTIACVLMFCLDRHEFPVDTHVWRIAKSLSWVPPKATRDQTYAHLNTRIPDAIKYDLHVLLVEHGKRCPRCATRGKPRKEPHGPCPLFGPGSVLKGSGKGPAAAAGDSSPSDNDQ